METEKDNPCVSTVRTSFSIGRKDKINIELLEDVKSHCRDTGQTLTRIILLALADYRNKNDLNIVENVNDN